MKNAERETFELAMLDEYMVLCHKEQAETGKKKKPAENYEQRVKVELERSNDDYEERIKLLIKDNSKV